MTNVDYALIFAHYLLGKIFKGISPIHVIERRSKTGAVARISPAVQNGIYSINHLQNLGEYSDLVAEFKEIFDEKLSHYNNTALYDRLESIRIEERTPNDKTADGMYLHDENSILINADQINQNPEPSVRRKTILFHELVHMATSYNKGIISIVGFSQMIGNKYCKGNGINEGYTELITQRYFARTIPNENGRNVSYPREQQLAYGIELLVGKEKMEKLFFNGDLDGLLAEMSNYMPLREANMLLGMADSFKEKKANRAMIEAAAKSIIANRLLQKHEALYRNGEISKEEYEFKLLEVEMFTRGYFFRKLEDGYELEPVFWADKQTISNEGYRVLQNHFKQSKKYGELYDERRLEESKQSLLIPTFYSIFNAEKTDGIDMSQVETLEVTDPIKRQYEVTPRMTMDTSSELSTMLEEVEQKTTLSQTTENNKK